MDNAQIIMLKTINFTQKLCYYTVKTNSENLIFEFLHILPLVRADEKKTRARGYRVVYQWN